MHIPFLISAVVAIKISILFKTLQKYKKYGNAIENRKRGRNGSTDKNQSRWPSGPNSRIQKTNSKNQKTNSKLTTLRFVDLRFAPIPENKFQNPKNKFQIKRQLGFR
jgi:hypothetical protein